MIQMAIMGFGTIGSGVYDVVNTNRDVIRKNLGGEELDVKYVLDLREFPGKPVEKVLVHDVNTIMEDPEVKIVVETMGGVEPAFTFVSRALKAGKSVATSNKELVAKKGCGADGTGERESRKLPLRRKCRWRYPDYPPLVRCLTADRIEEVAGILNGTTNYILTKMDQEGTSFEAALKEAQDNGFAEKNPEADVEGYDAGRKIAILSSLVLGKSVNFEDIYTEGISAITATDFKYARALGWSIKLVASGKIVDGKVYAMVAPHLVKPEHPLYAVNDVFNAVMVHGNMVDDVMFYGRGAGSHATASAVMADVVEEAANLGKTLPVSWSAEHQEVAPVASSEKQFLVRVKGGAERETVLAQAFGEGQLVQAEGVTGEIAYLTPVMTEEAFGKAAETVEDVIGRIRVK